MTTIIGATFCEQCKKGVPTTTAPFVVEVTDEHGSLAYVHGRCKAAWDKDHPPTPAKQ